jgi:Uma2 family endonuclease
LGLTIDDFEKLPEALARNHELVDGELVDVSGNTPTHNLLKGLLLSILTPLVREKRKGVVITEQEYDFDGNAQGPDISFIGSEKVSLLNRSLRVQRFSPDLAIEIVSANDSFEKLMAKAARYRSCGVSDVWIFSVALRQAWRYSEGGDAILHENDNFTPLAIPEFSIRIGELFDQI